MLNHLLRKKYLRRISGVKHEKFEKCMSKLKRAWASGTEAEARCRTTVWDWGLGGAFAIVVDVLSDVYDAFVFGANFQSG